MVILQMNSNIPDYATICSEKVVFEKKIKNDDSPVITLANLASYFSVNIGVDIQIKWSRFYRIKVKTNAHLSGNILKVLSGTGQQQQGQQ